MSRKFPVRVTDQTRQAPDCAVRPLPLLSDAGFGTLSELSLAFGRRFRGARPYRSRAADGRAEGGRGGRARMRRCALRGRRRRDAAPATRGGWPPAPRARVPGAASRPPCAAVGRPRPAHRASASRTAPRDARHVRPLSAQRAAPRGPSSGCPERHVRRLATRAQHTVPAHRGPRRVAPAMCGRCPLNALCPADRVARASRAAVGHLRPAHRAHRTPRAPGVPSATCHMRRLAAHRTAHHTATARLERHARRSGRLRPAPRRPRAPAPRSAAHYVQRLAARAATPTVA